MPIFQRARAVFYIIELTDPENPVFKNQWIPEDSYSNAIFVIDQYAYVAVNHFLYILNIYDPDAIVQTTQYDVGSTCTDAYVEGEFAFVTTSNSLRVFDVADPRNPVEVASQIDVFSTKPVRIEVNNSYIYVVCDGGGLYIFKFSKNSTSINRIAPVQTSEFSLKQNYPNPFNQTSIIRYFLPEKANVNLNIYNTSGQLIQRVVNEVQNAGSHSLAFDGANLSSGLYFLVLKTHKTMEMKKIVLLK